MEQRWRSFLLSLEAEMKDLPPITLITEFELDLRDLPQIFFGHFVVKIITNIVYNK